MKEYADMKLCEAVKYIPVRFVNLVNKLLGMKGIVLVITYILFIQEIIPEAAIAYTWIFIVLIVVFGEKALTFIKDLKK